MNRTRIYLALATLVVILAPQALIAAPRTVYFTGEVLPLSFTDTGNYLVGQIAPGTAITGKWTFDTDTPDSDADPEIGRYPHAGPYRLEANFGSVSVASGAVTMQILNNATIGIGTLDRYGVIGTDLGTFSVGGVEIVIDQFHLFLTDQTLTAHSSDALFGHAPIISAYDPPDGGFAQGQLVGHIEDRIGSDIFMNFTVTSAVPEASSLTFVGIAAAGAGLGMLRRWRQSQRSAE